MSNTRTAPSLNWLTSILAQADFYRRHGPRARTDAEFDWRWFEHQGRGLTGYIKNIAKRVLAALHLRSTGVLRSSWVVDNSEALWQTRVLLKDELSRLLFDSSLIVRMLDHQHYYFPRIDFDDMVDVLGSEAFNSEDLPNDYLGVPLRIVDLKLPEHVHVPVLRVITTDLQLHLLNSYRQYLIRRGSTNYTPRPGDVILDCGACIGEVSLVLAGLVGAKGEVHLFDPIPLHTRFCQLQASLNPLVGSVLRVNALAVGDRTHGAAGSSGDRKHIDPGSIDINNFAATTIDDYVANGLARVDFIKMDIEGSELAALRGASATIRRFKPDLAISGYHKPEDLWEIPAFIRALNPDYEFHFGHHSPVSWESVFYATDRNRARE